MLEVSKKVKQLMEQYEADFIETFHWFHQHPEMSFKEYETTAYIKGQLENLGIEIQDIGLETGVVGLLRGGSDGPCIAPRADIDALPVTEKTGLLQHPSVDKGG